MTPEIAWTIVKCSDSKCGKVTRTKEKEEFQCPKASGGCGKRFKVKECMVEI